MIFAALSEAADRGELLLVDGGLCRFHQRRDGVMVIREVIVLPAMRGRGIGRRLVERVLGLADGRTVQARCPGHYESNGFWEHLEFEREHTDLAGSTRINTWRHPNSSTAPTVILPSPG